MDTNQTQVLEIQLKLGSLMLDNAFVWLRDAFKDATKRRVLAGDIQSIFNANGIRIPNTQYDLNYYLCSWDFWQKFFEKVMLKKIPYVSDTFDCDNYSFYVSAMSALYGGVNSCGICNGVVWDKDTGTKVAGHVWNIIPTSDNSIYIYDLNNSAGWTKVESTKPTVIGNWRYTFDYHCTMF